MEKQSGNGNDLGRHVNRNWGCHSMVVIWAEGKQAGVAVCSKLSTRNDLPLGLVASGRMVLFQWVVIASSSVWRSRQGLRLTDNN